MEAFVRALIVCGVCLLVGCGEKSTLPGQNERQPTPASRPGGGQRAYSEPPPEKFGDSGISTADKELTWRIRRAIMADPELAAGATNISITAESGKVKLSGEVGSKQEQRALAAMVEKQTGAQPANNDLKVKSQVNE